MCVCGGLGNRGEKTRGPLSFPEKNLSMDILVPGTKNLCGSATGNTESVSGDSPNSQGPLPQIFTFKFPLQQLERSSTGKLVCGIQEETLFVLGSCHCYLPHIRLSLSLRMPVPVGESVGLGVHL